MKRENANKFGKTRLRIAGGALTLLTAVGMGGGSLAQAAPVPLVELTFNNGSLANTGSLGGTATTFSVAGDSAAIGEGLNGAGQGLDNTSADDFGSIDADGAGGLSYSASSAVGALTSYTVAGFYKIPVQGSAYTATNARLFREGGGNIDIAFTNGRIVVNGLSTPAFSTRATWGAIGQWVFFAVTYNQGTYTSYGATESNQTVASLDTQSDGTTQTGNLTQDFTVANFSSSGIRPFDGLMDSIRLYGSSDVNTSAALSLSNLQALATAGFNESPVPEPGTLLLILPTAALLAKRRRRHA